VYSIGLQINITDSVNNNTEEYLPDLNVYGIVPGMLTETFEHANLQKFHWQTYGDSEWEITSTDAQTGTYSVKPNEISEDQSTTLAIIVNLPRDTSMAFAVKMLTNSGRLNFRVDSNLTGSWNEIFDWKFFEYELDKGEHRLTWEFLNYYDAPASVFLDNIFFPANSVVTSINSIEQSPLEFKLYQNYPNPFNPTTKIKYSIPSVSQSPLPGGARGGWMNVQLKIYDILGREVATLVNKQQSPGNYDVEFNASNLSSGVYFYKLTAGELVETRKMLLLK
jgi:hypothetical protein